MSKHGVAITRDDLSTYDPYDIWKTSIGYRVKHLYNRNRLIGLAPAAILTVFDLYFNDRLRLGYRKQEYPIARAWAAQILLNSYEMFGNHSALKAAVPHLEWLVSHSCKGYSGPCWGLAFDYAVSADFQYDVNTPLTTMTPYALEAFVRYTELSGDQRFLSVIRGIFGFFDRDVPVLEETNDYLVTAYSAIADRRVINAVSYVMYSYSLLLPFLDTNRRDEISKRISKLLVFVLQNQREDGSWLYSPDGNSFVDCFHSCIVIKNLIKAEQRVDFVDANSAIEKGYHYLKHNLFDSSRLIFRRFSVTNKPGLIEFDLYDNAEMLNLSVLLGDNELAETLRNSIRENFVKDSTIFSQIDRFGVRHRANTLRWAVLPYLYSLSLTSDEQLSMTGAADAA